MASPLPEIRGYLPSTMIDWPGRVAAEVFIGGCNLRCGYCHARHLLARKPAAESIPCRSVLEHLAGRTGWIDGVVLSGGEATLDPRTDLLAKTLAGLGFPVKIDTNGTRPEVLARWISDGLVSSVAMDVKAPLDERYSQTTGRDVDLNALRQSIDLLMASDVECEFRTTVARSYTTTDDVEEIARAIKGADRYVVQGYRHLDPLDARLAETDEPSPGELAEMARAAAPYVRKALARGVEPAESA